MFLMAGFLIGVASTFIEVKLVNGVPRFRHAYEHGVGPIPGSWINNGFSILLSGILGGGATIVALMGMVFSTVFSNVYFSTQKNINNAGWDMQRVKYEMSMKREGLNSWWSSNKLHFVNLGKTIMVTIKIITAPIRFAIAANNKAHASKNSAVDFYNNTRAKVSHLKLNIKTP